MRKFFYLLLFLALTFVLITSCSEPEKLPKDFSSEEEKELEEHCKEALDEAKADSPVFMSSLWTDASQEVLERELGYNLREGLGFKGNYDITIDCSSSLEEGVEGFVTFSLTEKK
tara:strand:- start:107 stop:451 length:345 start_codon:yes stop_codon:yes gene_type:complete